MKHIVYPLAVKSPKPIDAQPERPLPKVSEARKKAFSVRPMTTEELDAALIRESGTPEKARGKVK